MSNAHAGFEGQPILITGASGFIGSHLCRKLRAGGAELHCVSRTGGRPDEPGVRWWVGDLADAATALKIVTAVRPHLVFHLASEVAGARDLRLVLPMLRSNLLSTVNLLTAVAEHSSCRRVVLAGSMEEPAPVDVVPVPCSPYAAAKWASAGYARMFHALFGVPAVALRVFMVYGPGQMDTGKLIPYVILSLLRGEAPRLSSGNRPVDWIYVEDVVDGFLSAAVAENVAGSTLDIGSGALSTVREIVEMLTQIVAPSIAPSFGALADRPLETVRVADAARTEQITGWKPRTRIREGLAKTAAWYSLEFSGHARSGL
jgi:UDP-glucose 4-epimerase